MFVKIGALPSSYLGLPLGAQDNSVAVWDVIEERFRKRLALWKRQYISKGGRLTLLRNTLSSLPIYHMSLFRLPRRVKLRLERIQRDFLWGGGSLVKKLHLVKWDTVCSDKREGGLGIRGFFNLNRALLSKWLWRFANERDSLWRKVINYKFGEDMGGWCSCKVHGSYRIGVWKEIRNDWDSFPPTTMFSVGNGRRVRFWKDCWCGEEPLSLSFPSLFSLAVNKEALVLDVWDPVGEEGGGGGGPLFSLDLSMIGSWKRSKAFCNVIQGNIVINSQEDILLMKMLRMVAFW